MADKLLIRLPTLPAPQQVSPRERTAHTRTNNGSKDNDAYKQYEEHKEQLSLCLRVIVVRAHAGQQRR